MTVRPGDDIIEQVAREVTESMRDGSATTPEDIAHALHAAGLLRDPDRDRDVAVCALEDAADEWDVTETGPEHLGDWLRTLAEKTWKGE